MEEERQPYLLEVIPGDPVVEKHQVSVKEETVFPHCENYRRQLETTVSAAQYQKLCTSWGQFMEDENEMQMLLTLVRTIPQFPELVIGINLFLQKCTVNYRKTGNETEYYIMKEGGEVELLLPEDVEVEVNGV